MAFGKHGECGRARNRRGWKYEKPDVVDIKGKNNLYKYSLESIIRMFWMRNIILSFLGVMIIINVY